MFDSYSKKSSNSLLSRHSTCPIPESNFTMRVKNHRCAPTGNCSHKPSEYMRDAIFQLSQLKKRKTKQKKTKKKKKNRTNGSQSFYARDNSGSNSTVLFSSFVLLSQKLQYYCKFNPKKRKEKKNYTREILM